LQKQQEQLLAARVQANCDLQTRPQTRVSLVARVKMHLASAFAR
jgi:hypothetical protein